MRRFDALTVGESRRSEAMLLCEHEMVGFAERYDPQFFHTDAEAARGSAFGGLIASGVHLLAIARRLDQAVNGDIAFHCGLAFEEVRFRRPARPNDRLALNTKLLSLADSRSNPGSGIATFAHDLRNQGELSVLSLRVVALIYR